MLKIGDKAPLFEATNHEGDVVKLADLLAKGLRVVLYFYPKDNTPGCTAEACSLRDAHTELVKRGFVILGVSPDSEASHVKFRDKQNIPFTLLTDPAHELAKAYFSYGPKKFMGREYNGILRQTFVIEPSGTVEKIFAKVETKNHAEQILKSYE